MVGGVKHGRWKHLIKGVRTIGKLSLKARYSIQLWGRVLVKVLLTSVLCIACNELLCTKQQLEQK
jgi:hypothetical protein